MFCWWWFGVVNIACVGDGIGCWHCAPFSTGGYHCRHAHAPHSPATLAQFPIAPTRLNLEHPPHPDKRWQQAGEPAWQALLRLALELGLHALIDCGALLAGTSNRCARLDWGAAPRCVYPIFAVLCSSWPWCFDSV